MKGILNIIKPPGMTSFDVISVCRRIFNMKKIGHAGTLDPGAAGVLAVCLGRGTKVVPFLTETRKSYRAEISFGVETTTLDAFGEVTNRVDNFSISREQLEGVLGKFRGEIGQIPPMYSAIKYKGKRLYELARQGKKVKRKERKITIYDLKLVDFSGDKAIIDVECSKGTYIRTLCADIGKELDVGAYMSFLVRLKVGEFLLEDAITLEDLQYLKGRDALDKVLLPLDMALQHIPRIQVKAEYDWPLSNGVSIELDNLHSSLLKELDHEDKYRVYNSKDELVGIYHWNSTKEIFKPVRLFVSAVKSSEEQ